MWDCMKERSNVWLCAAQSQALRYEKAYKTDIISMMEIFCTCISFPFFPCRIAPLITLQYFSAVKSYEFSVGTPVGSHPPNHTDAPSMLVEQVPKNHWYQVTRDMIWPYNSQILQIYTRGENDMTNKESKVDAWEITELVTLEVTF